MSRTMLARLAPLPALAALAALSCAAPEPPAAAPAGERQHAASAEESRHVFLTADGNELPYVDRGHGAATVVLVHCWMCDRTFWTAQIPALEPHYRVIALDLPGHGEASARREHWTIAGYGRDVADLLEHLDLHDVVLVGHSMGGPVCLRAAALAGGRVRGIVAVDTLLDAELDFRRPEVTQMVARFDTDFRGSCAAMVDQMFVEQGAEALAAEVRRRSCEKSDPAVGRALMHDFADIDFPAWFREAGVPIRAINSAGPNETRTEVNRKYADFDAVLMDGVGHYLHMTRPAEFNEHLLAILRELVG